MVYYPRKTISDRITIAQKTIRIAINDPNLYNTLIEYGYVDTSYNEGLRLQDVARQAEEQRLEQLGFQVAATTALKELYTTLRLTFDTDRRIARLLLRGNQALSDTFRLHIRSTRHRANFILQASHLYDQMRVHVDLLPTLSTRFNITLPVIEERLADLARLEAAILEQQRVIGEVRLATEKRRMAMDALDGWMKRFIRVARIAFQEDKARLRKLGILVKGG